MPSMSGRKPDIYRWERFSKPRVYSRSQVTTNDDIQDWIKKVEQASDRAAAAAFNSPAAQGGRHAVRARVEDAHLHDAAYSEAQDLLQEWVTNKLDFGMDNLDPDPDPDLDSWSPRRPTKSKMDIKKEWDKLVTDNEDDYLSTVMKSSETMSAATKRKEAYERLLEDDSDLAVEEIMQSMLEKDFVSDRVTNDLGLEDKGTRKDPSVKMMLRHQQVKENRLKREAERKKKLADAQAKKEAQLEAKRIVQKEAAEKESKKKREEAEINHQMALIRRQMQEEQRRAEEEKQRKKQEQKLKEAEAAEHLKHQQEMEVEARKQMAREDAERQRKIAAKIHEAETRNATLRLRLLHQYFGLWYSTVAERRLRMGKARAMADWKLLLRTWRAWRTLVISQRVSEDAQRHVEQVKERQRHQVRAEQHYRTSVLRRCLAAWMLFVRLQRRQREVSMEQKATKNKMAAFLQAAAAVSTNSNDEGSMTLRKSASLEDVASSRTESSRRRVDDFFSQPGRPRRGSSSAHSTSTTDLTDRSQLSSRKNSKTIQAWQITRKHAQLSKEELAKFVQGQGQAVGADTSRSDASEVKSDASGSKGNAVQTGRKPWDKKYVVNSTEHRTAAQGKILEQQQKQIKEQQRIIEELTYLQKQQMLQTQLTQQQLLRQQLAEPQVPGEASKLDKHLLNLQQSLLEQKPADNSQGDTTRVQNQPTTPQHGNKGSTKPVMKTIPNSVTKQSAMKDVSEGSKTSRTDLSSVTTTISTNRTTSSAQSKHSSFLKSMEERAAERARMKADREAKRLQAESERLEKAAAEAKAALEKEEEEKRLKVELYREKKRLERQREEEKQREAEHLRELAKAAELHHCKALLKFRGWQPWRRLMEIRRNRMVVAEDHYKTVLQRKALLEWNRVVHEDLEHKQGLADHMFNYQLVRRCFTNWRRHGEAVAIQEKKSVHFYRSRLVVRVFSAWRDYAEEEKIASWRKERKAKEHNLMRIQKAAFSALRRFPRMRREEEERERRRATMRLKVASMLSDYSGHEKAPEASADSDFFS